MEEALCPLSPTLVRLFLLFLRLGLTAFGGPAMIAYIRDLAVGREKWLAREDFQDGVALCQMIPGATAMQVAAYVGLRVRGVGGAVVSYVGFGLPAFLLMLGLSVLYSRTHTLPLVVAAFSGLQALIVAVVANAAFSFGRTTLTGWRQGGIALIVAALFWLRVHPVLILLLASLLGMALSGRQVEKKQVGSQAIIPAALLPLFALIAAAGAALALLLCFSPALAQLAMLMARIDLMAFGGGFASVPFMFHEIVEVRSWLEASTFLDGIALGQFTPGPIVITATFVGYLLHGIAGAGIATVAIFLPSLLLVIGIAPYFSRLRASLWFSRAISGVLCAFVGLLATVTIRFALQVHWDGLHLFLGIAALLALVRKVDILWVIVAGTVISMFFL
ncbi:MAG: chromate efflux transporter [Desulfocapsaceae bacterium]|nr:chromate efflux transporter [Desulfocapsaceae bacterium]